MRNESGGAAARVCIRASYALRAPLLERARQFSPILTRRARFMPNRSIAKLSRASWRDDDDDGVVEWERRKIGGIGMRDW